MFKKCFIFHALDTFDELSASNNSRQQSSAWVDGVAWIVLEEISDSDKGSLVKWLFQASVFQHS